MSGFMIQAKFCQEKRSFIIGLWIFWNALVYIEIPVGSQRPLTARYKAMPCNYSILLISVGKLRGPIRIWQFTSTIVLDVRLFSDRNNVNSRLWWCLLQYNIGKNVLSVFPAGWIGKSQLHISISILIFYWIEEINEWNAIIMSSKYKTVVED